MDEIKTPPNEREQLERAIAKRFWKMLPRKVRRTFSEMINLAGDFDPSRPAVFIAKFQSLLKEAQRVTNTPPPSLDSRHEWALKRMFVSFSVRVGD